MAKEDKDKTAFYTGERVFCYKKMLFGLKNTGATYQRLVDKVFSHQIGRNLEAYVDDMVIKSTSEKEMLKDIQETFKRKEKETPADFLVEIPVEDNEKKEKPKEAPVSNSKEYTYALRFKFETTNNEVEYEALLAGLWIAQEMEIAKVAIFLETQLLVNQIKGTFIAKQTSIKDYLQKVKTALRGFEEYTIEHVRRNQNKRANALSKLALMTFEHLTKEVLVEVLTKRSIKEKEVLKEDQNPGATIQANLRKDVQKILLHAMAPLITKQGYYWPSMHKEVAKSIQDYEKCKEQSAIRKAGTSMAITAGSTLPFSHWRIHILGSLPMAPG
nr:hypothetical protein [Tanacetum cinerariifolium]